MGAQEAVVLVAHEVELLPDVLKVAVMKSMVLPRVVASVVVTKVLPRVTFPMMTCRSSEMRKSDLILVSRAHRSR